ncbi:MAG: hypothetical protein MHPSP_001043 [Paramarteilia canceri]
MDGEKIQPKEEYVFEMFANSNESIPSDKLKNALRAIGRLVQDEQFEAILKNQDWSDKNEFKMDQFKKIAAMMPDLPTIESFREMIQFLIPNESEPTIVLKEFKQIMTKFGSNPLTSNNFDAIMSSLGFADQDNLTLEQLVEGVKPLLEI